LLNLVFYLNNKQKICCLINLLEIILMKKLFSALKKVLCFIALAFATMPAFSQATLLLGSWHLTAANKILPDGRQVADYGADPRGIAVFTADGHFVLEIFRSEHVKFASGDRAKGTVAFHTERASYPNWDEKTLVCSFILEGDKLTFRVPPRPDGSMPVSIFSRMP
jgi:hypothetical protein